MHLALVLDQDELAHTIVWQYEENHCLMTMVTLIRQSVAIQDIPILQDQEIPISVILRGVD
jgi:hypothetical protein